MWVCIIKYCFKKSVYYYHLLILLNLLKVVDSAVLSSTAKTLLSARLLDSYWNSVGRYNKLVWRLLPEVEVNAAILLTQDHLFLCRLVSKLLYDLSQHTPANLQHSRSLCQLPKAVELSYYCTNLGTG